VFDVDAIGLVTFADLLNHGLDLAGRPVGKGEQTSFVLGVGCNPGAVDLDKEVARFRQKIDAGTLRLNIPINGSPPIHGSPFPTGPTRRHLLWVIGRKLSCVR
jgi:hypothetical protein